MWVMGFWEDLFPAADISLGVLVILLHLLKWVFSYNSMIMGLRKPPFAPPFLKQEQL